VRLRDNRGPGAIPGLFFLQHSLLRAVGLQPALLDAHLPVACTYLDIVMRRLRDLQHLARAVGADIGATAVPDAVVDDAVRARGSQGLSEGLPGTVAIGGVEVRMPILSAPQVAVGAFRS